MVVGVVAGGVVVVGVVLVGVVLVGVVAVVALVAWGPSASAVPATAPNAPAAAATRVASVVSERRIGQKLHHSTVLDEAGTRRFKRAAATAPPAAP